MKKQTNFDSCIMNNLFPEGFHRVVCSDLNITTLKINEENIKLFGFTFFDKKLNESIWIQITISENDSNRILKMLGILLNKPIKYILDGLSSYKDILQKECFIHVTRNLAGASEIDGFMPLI